MVSVVVVIIFQYDTLDGFQFHGSIFVNHGNVFMVCWFGWFECFEMVVDRWVCLDSQSDFDNAKLHE